MVDGKSNFRLVSLDGRSRPLQYFEFVRLQVSLDEIDARVRPSRPGVYCCYVYRYPIVQCDEPVQRIPRQEGPTLGAAQCSGNDGGVGSIAKRAVEAVGKVRRWLEDHHLTGPVEHTQSKNALSGSAIQHHLSRLNPGFRYFVVVPVFFI